MSARLSYFVEGGKFNFGRSDFPSTLICPCDIIYSLKHNHTQGHITMDSMYEVKKELHKSTASLNYALEVFGDTLAKQENYQAHKGIDAIHFYICQKYHYLPHQARHLSFEDLHFLLAEEFHGWVLPPEAKN